MWNTVPAKSEVQSQLCVHAPVVLQVGCRGDVVPVTADLGAVFGILLSKTQQEVSIVIATERTVEFEVALSVRERVLDFLVDRPAETEFQLVSALGPGEIVTELIVVSLIVPRHPVDGVVRPRHPSQVN